MDFEDDWLNKSQKKFALEHCEQIDFDYTHYGRNPFVENTWHSSVFGDSTSYVPIDQIRDHELRVQVFKKYKSIFPADALDWWMEQDHN